MTVEDITPEGSAAPVYLDPVPIKEPTAPEYTVEELRAFRRAAYAAEADPLFFKWQRGEASEGEWLAAVEAIRAAYPYPEE